MLFHDFPTSTETAQLIIAFRFFLWWLLFIIYRIATTYLIRLSQLSVCCCGIADERKMHLHGTVAADTIIFYPAG